MINLSKYYKNIAVLTAGTAASHLILLTAAVFLTRLYTPENFGEYSIAITICSLLMIVSTLRYEHGIVIAKDDSEANHLVLLIIMISVVFFMLIFTSAFIFIDQLHEFFSIGYTVYFIPFIVLIMSVSVSIFYRFNRDSNYRVMSASKVVRSTAQVLAQLFFYFLVGGSEGLLYGYVLGELSYLLYFLLHFSRRNIVDFERVSFVNAANSFSNFPKFDVPTAFLNTLVQMLPIILIGYEWGAEKAGFYALTQRVLSAPITFVGLGYLHVFKKEVSVLYNNKKSALSLYIETIKIFFWVSIIPIVVVFMYGREVFAFVFGENWSSSGMLAEMIAVFLFFRLMASPSVYILFNYNKQNIGLVFNAIFFLFMALSYFFAPLVEFYGDPFLNFIGLYVISLSILYAMYILYTYNLLNKQSCKL